MVLDQGKLRLRRWPSGVTWRYCVGIASVALACASNAQNVENSTGSSATRAIVTVESVSQAKRNTAAVMESGAEKVSSRRVALVIGNASYQRIPRLANPRHDAQDVCATLKSLQFEVVCLYDVATRRDIREAVRVFASKLDPRSAAFFFYAGHGVQVNGENYLLPTNVDARSIADIEEDGLSLSYVLRSLEEVRSSPNIVILDACRENPFPKLAGAGVSRGLARTEPPVGTMLVYATAPNGVALDGTGRNGLFTKYFLNHAADSGKKIDEVFQLVAKAVEDEARTQRIEQVPYRSSSYSGAFCLASCENPEIAAELEQIKLQRAEASKRVNALQEENAQLRRQAAERSSKVAELEEKIAALSRDVSATGDQNTRASKELSQLRAALDAARQEQAESELAKRRTTAREAEIAQLKEQMADLQLKALQLDAYRKQLETLQNQSNDTSKRMQVLAEENSRLKRLAEEKSSNVASLESRIVHLSKEVEADGRRSSRGQLEEELKQLRTTLAEARAEQLEAERMKKLAANRESEIVQLKEQLNDLNKRSQQLGKR